MKQGGKKVKTDQRKKNKTLLRKGQLDIFFFLNQNNEMWIPLWIDIPYLWVKQKTGSIFEHLSINRTQQITSGREA